MLSVNENTSKLRNRINELLGAYPTLTPGECAGLLNKEGFTTSKGTPVRPQNVGRISTPRKTKRRGRPANTETPVINGHRAALDVVRELVDNRGMSAETKIDLLRVYLSPRRG